MQKAHLQCQVVLPEAQRSMVEILSPVLETRVLKYPGRTYILQIAVEQHLCIMELV